ncbi:MAG: urease accessory protein UreF [Hyphomicrobiales bacterium]|nr:urease accessory protein UreF [Hyphomicrobiales bacterium]
MQDGPASMALPAVALPPELMIWLSPGFPVGAFAFSHGLEKAVENGLVRGEADLLSWVRGLITNGSLRTDLVILACAWRACSAADVAALVHVNDMALALQAGAERRLETATQGNAFVRAISDAWPAATGLLERFAGGDVAYPVAVGAAAAALPAPLMAALSAYAIAAVANFTSTAIRLSVTGQTGAQRVLAGTMGDIDTACRAAQQATLDDLGSSTFLSDLCSLLHETQHTRLFRS